MAPQVPENEVYFYTQEEYGGSKNGYKIGDDVNLWPGPLNDKFQSAAVGSGAKVLAWQHGDASGVFAELTGANPSLKFIGGLTRFRVIDDDTRVIAFKFVDGTGTGAAPRQYSLKVDAADVGDKILYSNDTGGDDNDGGNENEGFKLVGTIPEGGSDVTTAVYVRDESSGSYIATGSAYFRWNADSKQVDLDEKENFPPQLKAERAGPSKFIITLISTEPSS